MNKFFIQLAIKFFINCNLNLLLTKYLKKFLKFQLKNEIIEIYIYIIFTKLIDNF